MALKAVLKSLDGLEDPIKALYKKEGDEYRLDVEGMVPKATLDEFRETNISLKKENDGLKDKLKQFDGVDLAKWKELQATEQKLKDGELIKAGKIDELITSRLDPIKKEFQSKLDAAQKEKEQLASQLETLQIDDQLTKLATTKGLRPTAIEDMLARGRRVFRIKDGKVVALDKDGAQLLTKSGDPLNMQAWVDSLATEAPHLFQSSTGGGAQNNGNKGAGAKTMTRAEFEKLAPQARVDFTVKEGGTVTD